MSGRDLLYKPQVPILVPEESEGGKAGGKKPGMKGQQSRDLGGVGPATPMARQPSGAGTDPNRMPAHKAAYFNQDISGVREVNHRASTSQAMRGAQGASDLRKVVLPPAMGIETPDPVQLRAAGDLMGLDGSFAIDLQNLLARQHALVRSPGVTVELVRQRIQMLEQLVAMRRAALQRMRQGRSSKRASSVTLEHAELTDGHALEGIEDIASYGAAFVQRTAAQAEGMHQRLAKMLGIKRPKV